VNKQRFMSLIGAGFTGGIALILIAGIFVVLVGAALPAVPYFGIGQRIQIWTQSWTIEKVYTFFIFSGAAGVVIGAIIGWRSAAVLQKYFWIASFLGVPIIFGGWLLYAIAMRVETPQRLKLSDCSQNMAFHLKMPVGHSYSLSLCFPPDFTNKLSGNVTVFNGEFVVTNFVLSSEIPERYCGFFVGQSNYDIKIAFKEAPPNKAYVSLSWLQEYKDIHAHAKNRN
jgi:hypothetical protein